MSCTRIPLEEALLLISSSATPLSSVNVPLADAIGLVLAESVVSAIDQPPFARSPYDGYALIAADSCGASRETPVTLSVAGASYAGSPSNVRLNRGQAIRIMTGGVIPEGADCVIMQERTDCGEHEVRIFQQLASHDNICDRGEDFRAGDLLVSAGMMIGAAEYAVLTSAGCGNVKVFPSPRVSVFSTGRELVRAGAALSEGQIYDSNSAFVGARLRELDVPCVSADRLDDDLDILMQSFASAAEHSDCIISTGGVSVGEKDLVPEALERLGAELIFHGVDIKPGMPAACAILNGVPILALSGNPFAAAVSFELLARPVLARLGSNPGLVCRMEEGRLLEAFRKPRPIRRFMRAFVRQGLVILPSEQGNGQLLSMIGCNCLAELPSGEAPLAADSPVAVYLL